MTFPDVRHAKCMEIDARVNLRSIANIHKPGNPLYDTALEQHTYWVEELKKRLDEYEKETGSRPF